MSSKNDFLQSWQKNYESVHHFLDQKLQPLTIPLYSSLDIRDAGWKLCAVDVNVFPGGFNNLNEEGLATAGKEFKAFFAKNLPGGKPLKIALVPEAHTSNKGYLYNLHTIISILNNVGIKVNLIWPGPPIPKEWTIKLDSEKFITYQPQAGGLNNVDAIILNNDLSPGPLEFLKNSNLPIFPSETLGWYRRSKSEHFDLANALLDELSSEFSWFDPWYFSSQIAHLKDFKPSDSNSIEEVLELSQKLLGQLTIDYKERSIGLPPRLFLKNNSGTYGMGVLSLNNVEDIRNSISTIKRKFSRGKEAVPVTDVILQEAIPTIFNDSSSNYAAEPVLYVVNGKLTGAFMRQHASLPQPVSYQNLNQPGASFYSLDKTNLSTLAKSTIQSLFDDSSPYQFLVKLHTIVVGLETCNEQQSP